MAIRTISNAGGDWLTTGAWVEGVVPTNADDVVATATSATTAPLLISNGAVCRSLDFTGFTKTVSGAATNVLTIGSGTAGPGDVILKIHAGGIGGFAGTIVLNTSASTTQTVTIPSTTLSCSMTVSGTGSIQLLTNMTLSSKTLLHTGGTLDLNGKTLAMNQLQCQGSNARTLIFGAATVTLNVSGAFGVDVSGSNYTISAASATFNMGPSAGFQGGSATYGTVRWALLTTQNPAITGSNTFSNLSFTAGGTFPNEVHIIAGTTQTVTGTLTIAGTNAVRIQVGTGLNNFQNTFTAGGTATFALGATGTANLSHVSFMDIIITGTNAPVSGTRLGDGGGNTGIIFDTPRTLYWVGNAGNWSDLTNLHWALTSGGTPGASIPYPLPQDNVFVNGTSITIPNQTITCDVKWLCHDLIVSHTQTGCAIKTAATSGIVIFGSLGLSTPGITFDTLQVRSRTASTLATNQAILDLTLHCPGGMITSATDITANQVKLMGGTWDAAGYNVSLLNFDAGPIQLPITRELRMGSGTWTMRNASSPGWRNDTVANLFTLTRGSSKLLITGSPPATADVTPSNQAMPATTIDLTVGKSARLIGPSFASVTHLSGTLDFGTTGPTCGSFESIGDAPRTITGTTGVITVNGPITFSGTNLTFTPGTGTIQCTPTSAETNVYTNGVTFYTIQFTPPIGGEITVYGPVNAPFVTTTGPIGVGTVSFTEAVTATTRFTGGGNSTTNRLRIYGPAWGGTVPITTPTTQTINNMDLINIVQAGAGAWTGTSKTNSFTGWTSQAIGA